MDLYEYLISGWTEKELIEKFYTELNAAQVKLREEEIAKKAKIKQKKEGIKFYRHDMIYCMISYFGTLLGGCLTKKEIDQLDSIFNEYFEAIEDAVFADPTL